MKQNILSPRARALIVAAIVVVVVVCLTAASVTQADAARRPRTPRVMDPRMDHYGLSYAEWAAEWWTWVIEEGFYPLVDSDGSHCAEGQSGDVWFLAGSWVGPVTRECTIPRAKSLMFPVLNNVWIAFPEDDPYDEEEMRADLAEAIDTAEDMLVTVDGAELDVTSDYRVQSPAFWADLPADNAFGWPEMVTGPNLDDGYYVMLPPLTAGAHTVRIQGTLFPDTPDEFTIDVTYDLDVLAGTPSGGRTR